MTFDMAKLERRLAALEANRGASLRFGTVTEVSEADGTARVQLPDGQNMVSHPLRVMQARSLKDKKQCFPDVGEPVACLFAGQGFEQGVVLGAVYSPKCAAPNQQSGQDYTKYEDGTEIWYDRKSHKLIAKVKGDVEAKSTGNICLEAAKEITFKAPHINMLGNLDQRGYDGGTAVSNLHGDYAVRNGSIYVPEHNVIAGNVSLREHEHDNVQSGESISGKPVGGPGSGGSLWQNEAQVWKAAFDILCKLLRPSTTDKEDLLLCLPAIAEAEAGRQEQRQDREGWLHLQAMFHKWFSGIPNTPTEPYWLDWAWLEKYPEIQDALQKLSDPAYLFNEAAELALKKLVRKEKLLENPRTFDCTVRDWPHWKPDYFQRVDIGYVIGLITGLTTAIGRATLCALPKGRVEKTSIGYDLIITGVAIVLLDSFNFGGKQALGLWHCEDKKFLVPYPFNVENADFRKFRERKQWGNDFLVLAPPKYIEREGVFEYVISI